MAELDLIDERAPTADARERFIPRSDASVLVLRTCAIADIIAQVFHATVVAACDEQFATSTGDRSLVRGAGHAGPVMRVDPYWAFTIPEETRRYLDSRSALN